MLEEYKAMELYNRLNVYHTNNIHGRYNKAIKETQKELDRILESIEKKGRE